VTDLAEGAVADVDPRAVDAAVRARDDGLHGGELFIAVECIPDLLQPVGL
jgi:hypothetical protein